MYNFNKKIVIAYKSANDTLNLLKASDSNRIDLFSQLFENCPIGRTFVEGVNAHLNYILISLAIFLRDIGNGPVIRYSNFEAYVKNFLNFGIYHRFEPISNYPNLWL